MGLGKEYVFLKAMHKKKTIFGCQSFGYEDPMEVSYM